MDLPIFSRAKASSTSHQTLFSIFTKAAPEHNPLICPMISDTIEDLAILLCASEYCLRYSWISDFKCLFPVEEVYSFPLPQSTVYCSGEKSSGSLVRIPRL